MTCARVQTPTSHVDISTCPLRDIGPPRLRSRAVDTNCPTARRCVCDAARLGESVQSRRWRSELVRPSDPARGCRDWLTLPRNTHLIPLHAGPGLLFPDVTGGSRPRNARFPGREERSIPGPRRTLDSRAGPTRDISRRTAAGASANPLSFPFKLLPHRPVAPLPSLFVTPSLGGNALSLSPSPSLPLFLALPSLSPLPRHGPLPLPLSVLFSLLLSERRRDRRSGLLREDEHRGRSEGGGKGASA